MNEQECKARWDAERVAARAIHNRETADDLAAEAAGTPAKVRRFKFRGEYAIDLFRAGVELHDLDFKVGDTLRTIEMLPGGHLTATWETNLTFTQLLQVLNKVIGGHVMVETLAPEEDFTGERDYVRPDPGQVAITE